MQQKLRIAVQKSGRLQEESVRLLREAGLDIETGKNKLKATATNLPVELFFLRDDDIPGYVSDGVADAGVIGRDVFAEQQSGNEVVSALGFARCRLSLAVPSDVVYTGVSWLDGKRIATSFPNLLNQFLVENNINAAVHLVSGSVEITTGIGLADAICDLVSTGSTLASNNLKEVQQVFASEAIMIANPAIDADRRQILDCLLFRIAAVQKAAKYRYILLNCPDVAIDAVSAIIPGMKSPTVLPLAQEGWSSLHSVVDENDFWSRIDRLKAAGAEGILVVPIEKMIL
jgi:ATP phosphoribosyltransferase